jgi:hypothetical protein
MEMLEKVLPFLVHFPRWLQAYFFVVLLQILILVFLCFFFSFRFTLNANRPTTVKAVPVDTKAVQSQSKTPQFVDEHPVSKAPIVPSHKAPLHQDRQTRRAPQDEAPRSLRVSSVLEEEAGFPVLKVSVVNASTSPIILTDFDMKVLDYRPYAAFPESHVLTPIAMVDVVLPFGTGIFSHKLDPPIMVAANDAVMVAYRFHVEYEGKTILPSHTAQYRVQLVLRADNGLTSSTDIVTF